MLTGAHMSSDMLGTGEGSLTDGTFVVTSHCCCYETSGKESFEVRSQLELIVAVQ